MTFIHRVSIQGLSISRILLAGAVVSGIGAAWGAEDDRATPATQRAETIRVDGRELQAVVDAAPPNSVVLCDPNECLARSVPLMIRKPLTLRALHARLPEKLSNTPLVIVASKGVTVVDFELTGNVESVPQSERAPLLVLGAGDFRVENGRLINSSKDGIMIDGSAAVSEDLVGGVVRDIVGRGNARDLVSVGGSGANGHRIRNVLIDNVRCYDSSLRGGVEVSDGTDNVTVRKVYAESSVYAVDVQDHGTPGQINSNVVVQDVYAVRCKHAIRTANKPLGHVSLTVRDITAEQCANPIQISNTDNLTLCNVRVIGHQGKGHPVHVKNCRGAVVRDVMIENTAHQGPAMLCEDCDGLLLDGLSLRGTNQNPTSGVCFRVNGDKRLSGLRISNVLAPGVEGGILLESAAKAGTLADYVISGNLARVTDRIQGPGAIIANNLRDQEAKP